MGSQPALQVHSVRLEGTGLARQGPSRELPVVLRGGQDCGHSAGAGEARGRCLCPVPVHDPARAEGCGERRPCPPAAGALTLAAEGLVRDLDVAAALSREAVGGAHGTGQEPGHRELCGARGARSARGRPVAWGHHSLSGWGPRTTSPGTATL